MKTLEPIDSQRKCPVCGKMFWAHDAQWAYKKYLVSMNGTVWFCSWGCLRRFEKEKPEIKETGKKMSNRQRVIQCLKDGLNPNEIALLLDISPATVRYYIRGIKNDEKRGQRDERETGSESSSEEN